MAITSQVQSLLSSSDIQALIQQASAANQLPAATLQSQEKPIESQISALGKVQGALSNLQSALAQLSDLQNLSQRTVQSSATGIVTAAATNAAPVGNYSLSNVHLAQAETLISSGSASASGSLGSGSISIQVGSGTAVTVNITSGSSSLSAIAAAIDQANTGVNASVVFDGSSYRLALTGKGTGTANAFTVSGTGGLAGLSYHTGAFDLTDSQDAANAGFSLNGISITSGSNTVSGVIPGVTLTLAGNGSATVSVSQNITPLDDAAQGVVQALNQTLNTINQETAFSATSGAGPLLGNVGVEQLRQTLLNSLTAEIGVGGAPGGTSFNSLSSVGFQIASGGTITLDNAAFESAAQGNYAAVASLLGAVGIASNPNVAVTRLGPAPAGTYAVVVTSNNNGAVSGTINGLAASGTDGVLVVNGQSSLSGLDLQIQPGVTGNLGTVTVSQGLFGSLSSVVTAALASGSGGAVGQINSLNTTIASMNKQIVALQKQAAQETQNLTNQFTAAEATLNQLSTVSSFLTTYFTQTSG
ncbi:MAG TPA: flagellar filament capping protein FliD [Stellaceae bacterium]|jgi:flagellar hook-associated protein 2|nr:flagellar filament capping protein FliD [Stellaceae bacterium]